ncbi:hypothetical protein QFZ20_005135 [Flavobacterium sp. W4I14]|nr:hypothetical protein [Flavobacterium sp. W4I14]
MKNLKLESFGVLEMDAKEMLIIDGGGKGWGGWFAVIDFIVENGEDIYNGFSDGWNGKPKRQ